MATAMAMETAAAAAAAAPQELRFAAAPLRRLPQRPPAARPDDDLRREMHLHVSFFFVLLVASGFVYVAGNPPSSVAPEDVLALFAFWILCLLIFFAFFALPEAAARVVAGVLNSYLLGGRVPLIF